jgi:hypothetical protein
MLVVPAMTLSVQESTVNSILLLISAAGVVVFCVGVFLYLYVLVRDRKDAAVRSRQGSEGIGRGREVSKRPT